MFCFSVRKLPNIHRVKFVQSFLYIYYLTGNGNKYVSSHEWPVSLGVLPVQRFLCILSDLWLVEVPHQFPPPGVFWRPRRPDKISRLREFEHFADIFASFCGEFCGYRVTSRHNPFLIFFWVILFIDDNSTTRRKDFLNIRQIFFNVGLFREVGQIDPLEIGKETQVPHSLNVHQRTGQVKVFQSLAQYVQFC